MSALASSGSFWRRANKIMLPWPSVPSPFRTPELSVVVNLQTETQEETRSFKCLQSENLFMATPYEDNRHKSEGETGTLPTWALKRKRVGWWRPPASELPLTDGGTEVKANHKSSQS